MVEEKVEVTHLEVACSKFESEPWRELKGFNTSFNVEVLFQFLELPGPLSITGNAPKNCEVRLQTPNIPKYIKKTKLLKA